MTLITAEYSIRGGLKMGAQWDGAMKGCYLGAGEMGQGEMPGRAMRV